VQITASPGASKWSIFLEPKFLTFRPLASPYASGGIVDNKLAKGCEPDKRVTIEIKYKWKTLDKIY
jgi:hypothetical protein